MRPWPGAGTDYRKASVLILLYPRSGEDYVIFTRRTDTVEHHKGQISLPGGSQDPTDPDPVYTALRETHEELGVDPDLLEVVTTLGDVYVPVSGFVITPVVARLVSAASRTRRRSSCRTNSVGALRFFCRRPLGRRPCDPPRRAPASSA